MKNKQTCIDKTGRFLIFQEKFLSDGLMWIRCSYTRKTFKVKYNNKQYTIYEPESVYMTEAEWIKVTRT
jgi:hypothetical protein